MTLWYTGSRESGEVAVTGILHLTRLDTIHMEGSWRLRVVGDPTGLGHQDGEGSLVGTLTDSSISFNLNPEFIDNNILGVGVRVENGFEGTWVWVGYPGVLSQGSFHASICPYGMPESRSDGCLSDTVETVVHEFGVEGVSPPYATAAKPVCRRGETRAALVMNHGTEPILLPS